MPKKKDLSKCEKCGHKIALATAYLMDVEVEFDQEPYEADVIEPVCIDGKPEDTICLDLDIYCHVCPRCKWVRDFSKSD